MFNKNTTYQKVTIIGRVCGIPNGGTSATGTRYSRLPIQELKTGTIYTVVCFGDMVDQLVKFKPDDKLSVYGKKDKIENNITAEALASDTGKRTAYDSPDVKSKRQKHSKEYFENFDMVPTDYVDDYGNISTIWAGRESCVLLPNGKYKLKVEYLMDEGMVGAAKLNQIIREITGGKLNVDAKSGRRIREAIDKLVLESMEF